MILTNSSRYPDDVVADLIRIGAAEVDLHDVAVSVQDARHGYRGLAYQPIPRSSPFRRDPRVSRLIVIGIAAPDRFPMTNLVTTTRWLPFGTTRAEAERKAARREGDKVAYRWASTGRPEVTDRGWRMQSAAQYGIRRRHPYGGLKAPLIELADWREAIVAVAAHEAHHIATFRAGGRHYEAECEHAAARALARYRAGDRLRAA